MTYSLYLQYSATGKIFLDGAGITKPVRGCQYNPGRGARRVDDLGRETITEEITVDLAGTFAEIANWITDLTVEFELFKAGTWHRNQSGSLKLCYVDPDETLSYNWFSEVLDGRLELDAHGLGQRMTGQQLVKITITREDRWEHTNTLGPVLLNLPQGGTQATYGYLLNHTDATAGHANWGWCNPDQVAGDLPLKTSLQAFIGGGYLGDFLVGVGWLDVDEDWMPWAVPTLEESALTAGTGVTKTSTADEGSTGGSYGALQWSATSQVELFKGTVPNALYKYLLSDNRPFKPVMRLASSQAVTDLWLQLVALVGGTGVPMYESEWFLAPTGIQALEFPPIYLPPAGMEENTQIDVSLRAISSSGGTKILAVDFLQLWPVDGGFRKYKSLAYFASAGQLLDRGERSTVCWSNSVQTVTRASIAPFGPALRLMPGRRNVIAVANLASGTGWNIGESITLYMMAVKARRNL